MHVLPDGRIFVSANQQAMILDWKRNTETRLPGIPNGVRISSPFSAGAVLLPLTPANNFTPEIMICGGATVSDRVDPSTLSSQTPASDQCARLVLTTAGIAAGWKVERMPQTRIFVELVLLPDGRVLLVNGARTGVAGYGNVSDSDRCRTKTRSLTQSAIGRRPNRPKQRRQPNSHSSCVRSQRSSRTKILVRRYPCINHPQNVGWQFADEASMIDTQISGWNFSLRPTCSDPAQPIPGFLPRSTLALLSPLTLCFHRQLPVLLVRCYFRSTGPCAYAYQMLVNIIDLGFATHGVHMDQRLVQLRAILSADKRSLRVIAPANGRIYPPGPAFVYVVTNEGVPSFGHKTIIGTGASPPVNQAAIDKYYARQHTWPAAVAKAQAVPSPTSGEGSHVASEVIPAPEQPTA
ncbi:copper radical oxidase [Salix suchowensis]|nr:copper radical oxidase [Salix suchowensis]